MINDMIHYWTKMFNYTDRLNRRRYMTGFIGNAIFLILSLSLLGILFGFIAELAGAGDEAILPFLITLAIIVFLAYTLAFVSAVNRRLRDAGFNPWWTVAIFITFVQVVPFVMSFFPSKSHRVTTHDI